MYWFNKSLIVSSAYTSPTVETYHWFLRDGARGDLGGRVGSHTSDVERPGNFIVGYPRYVLSIYQ
jgi:hypothetical protein